MTKQKKILLVNPACLDERVTSEDATIVPIGLYYIAAQLLDHGFPTQILNLADAGPKAANRTFSRALEAEQPDIIGFSVTNPNRWNAIECAKKAMQQFPSTCIVFGGPAATFLTDHLFEVCPQLDFIVQGEGETCFLELVQSLAGQKDTSAIPGLVSREGSPIPPVRECIDDLDTLVHPSRYFTYQHLAMSRGCPGKCTFCGSPKFWRHHGVRFHSPQWFADEIQALNKKGVDHFYISDDTFTMDKDRVIDLCRLLIDRKLSITWNAISRVDYIDDDILMAMRQAGCIQLSFGVESGSEKIRKVLGKPIDREKIVTAFDQTLSHGIFPRAYFIYGSPGETQQTIQESIALLNDIRPLGAIFYMLVIFPGTHLYQLARQKGKISDNVWHEKIEDIPWFEVDDQLDFSTVKALGDELRNHFFTNIDTVAQSIKLIDKKQLYPFHADFLSRLALTFSHGEYANDLRVNNQDKTAQHLFKKALDYAPDARAFLGLAMLLQKSKKFNAAIMQLEKGLAQWPDNPELNTCMGVCLMNTKKFSAALPYFEKFKTSPGMDHYINICNQQIAGK